jgi:hypothetical protein
MKLVFIIVLLACGISCGFVARKGFGAKKPKTENKTTITEWLQNNAFSTDNIVSALPQNYYDFMPGLSQAPLLFDRRTGNLLAIGFSNGKYCPKDIDKSFSSVLPYQMMKEKPDSFLISETIIIPPGVSIKSKSKYESKKDTLRLSLPEMTKKIMTLGGDPVNSISDAEDDYTLILPFALFLGEKLQLKDLKKFYFSARINRFAKIRIVFLNLDKQEWWGEEWNKKINITY